MPSFIIPIKSDRIFAGWPSHNGVHTALHIAHYICSPRNGHIGGNSVKGREEARKGRRERGVMDGSSRKNGNGNKKGFLVPYYWAAEGKGGMRCVS